MKYSWKLCLLVIITTLIISTESGRTRTRRREKKRKQKNCYEKLEVGTDESEKRIKKAFRKLAMKYHPDKVKPEEKEEAEATFKELAHCYEILSDAQKRQQYDASGYNEQFASQSGGGPGAFHFEGSFEDIFGSFFGKGNKFGFENMFTNTGGSGSGFEHMFGGGPQFNFGGGQRGGPQAQNMYGGHHQHRHQSARKQTKAKTKAKRIYVDLEDLMQDSFKTMGNMEVLIPKGTPDGYKIEGSGMEFEVYGKPHADYTRGQKSHKSDLYTNVSITLEQALLGFDLEIMTIDGELIQKYMESVPPSMEYQIKRKGLARFGSSATTRGHLFIHFDVQLPTLHKKDRDNLKKHLLNNAWDYSEARRYRKKMRERTDKRNKRRNKLKTEL